MQYDVSFGTLGKAAAPPAAGQKFRLAVLADCSGRANAGRLATGAALGAARPIKVDVDNLDDVIAKMRLTLSLDLTGDGQTVAVPIGGMDDFHPDQLAESLDVFAELTMLRRNLGSKTGFDRAAKQVLSWGGGSPLPPPPRQARGATIAKDCKLSDFARLTGRAPVQAGAAEAAEHSADALVRRLVGPFVQPARDARQDQLVARVDEALSAAMRRMLHHPDFQAMEAVWRGVEFLVRRIETGARMEIVLYDVSAEELAADLAATDTLAETGLYAMLAEAPRLDAGQGPLSAVLGLYGFELSPPHADLLGRVAKIAAGAGAPFVASIAPDALATPIHDQHPLIKDAWAALQGLQEAAYLGLATPRFLLRMPYGRKSDPIDAFAFEEFTRQSGLSGMLWGHPALLAGLLLAESFKQQGMKMKPGSITAIGDIPYYVYVDPDGNQTALPCTERLYSERQAVMVSTYRVMPVLSLRGRPEVRLGGFAALGGGTLAGFWAPVAITAAPPPQAAPAAPEPVPAAPEPAAAAPGPAPTPGVTDADLDALLAGLETLTVEPAAEPANAPAEPAAAADPMADLDALLASLSAEPPPPAPDATESDLDALLASLQ
jgi:type VI secretion system protein ImpC